MRPIVTDQVAWSIGLSVYQTNDPVTTSEPIEMPVSLWARMNPKNYLCPDCTGAEGRCRGNDYWLSIYGMHVGATWRIRRDCSCAAATQPYVKLLRPLVVGIIMTYKSKNFNPGQQ